ncbi:hypothetical protein [Undibacterium sp. Ren11W]|uniref:hypothetical protein n=1 Tax=Undibacterium sp. Ren11W TaxID=3413045 RepID=UPI003BF43CE7
MKLSFDNCTTIAKVGLVVLVAAYAWKRGAGGIVGDIGDKLASVVMDFSSQAGSAAVRGVEAVVAVPLDVFGVVPAKTPAGNDKWVKTTPWSNPDNPVADNDSGINFGLF